MVSGRWVGGLVVGGLVVGGFNKTLDEKYSFIQKLSESGVSTT